MLLRGLIVLRYQIRRYGLSVIATGNLLLIGHLR